MILASYLRKNLIALLLVCGIAAVLAGYFLTRTTYKQTLQGYGRSATIEPGSCVLSTQDELYLTGCNSTL